MASWAFLRLVCVALIGENFAPVNSSGAFQWRKATHSTTRLRHWSALPLGSAQWRSGADRRFTGAEVQWRRGRRNPVAQISRNRANETEGQNVPRGCFKFHANVFNQIFEISPRAPEEETSVNMRRVSCSRIRGFLNMRQHGQSISPKPGTALCPCSAPEGRYRGAKALGRVSP